MFHSAFERITYLEYKLKAKNDIIAAYESGEQYVKIQESMWSMVRHLESRIKNLETELERAYRLNTTMRKNWMDVFEDLEKEMQKKEKASNTQIKNLLKKLFTVEHELNNANEKIKEQRQELYEVKTELEEKEGIIQQLRAQINRDYENSSIPSSKSIKNKKITNSREKTGRKPGAQAGHKHHGRKKQTPTEPVITLMPSQEILKDPDFKPTGKFITKQLVSIELCLHVQEYTAEIYRNTKTGERIHGVFPEGVVDDVNYDGSIKAFLYLLNNDCNVSIPKCQNFLSELTNGKLSISTGMINKLSKELAPKSETERKKLFADIQISPVMHINCTNAKVNGKSAYVFVNATPDAIIEDDKIKEIENRYREILWKAKEEYDYEPPSKYYMDGYNLYKRMEKYIANHLLFFII